MSLPERRSSNRDKELGIWDLKVADEAAVAALPVTSADLIRLPIVYAVAQGTYWYPSAAGTPGTFTQIGGGGGGGSVTESSVRAALALSAGAVTTNGQTVNGRAMATDGTKLDGMSANADVTSAALVAAGTTIAHVATAAERAFGATGDISDLGTKAAGATGLYADAGHVHQISTATPAALGTATVGVSSTPARGDHVHQIPTYSLGEFGATGAPGTTSARYAANSPGGSVSVAERTAYRLAPFACTLTQIVGRHNVAMTTDSVAVTIQVDAVDTAITKSVAATVQAFSDKAHTVAVTEGQRVSVKLVQSSTETNATLDGRYDVMFAGNGA